MRFPILNFTFCASILLSASSQTPAPPCKEWQTCRQLALEAAERKEYETFLDLSWRAFNAGPRNNPELMAMLARAQSLSGRPGDALVMLQRLAGLGVTTDAATNDDFANVRALPGWAELEAKLEGKPSVTTAAPSIPKPATEKSSAVAPEPKTDAKTETKTAEKIDKPAEPAPKPAPPAKPGRTAKPSTSKPTEPAGPLAFSTSGLTAVGLAYDAVSSRYIIADARDRRLLVLGERSGSVSSLAGLDAGFGEIGAFEIDTVEGDLWVVSTSAESRAAAHKLQLISGRLLSTIPLPAELGAARFADVAVTPQSVLVLDATGRRVLRAAKKGKTLDLAVRLPTTTVTSLAPAADGIAYAAFDAGLMRIDLAARSMTVVEPAAKVDLSGVSWMRWYRGSLVGLQKDASGATRAVRIRLDESGRSAKVVEALDEGSVAAGPTTAGVAGTTLFYLIRRPGSEEVEIRKVALK
jgi:hypothetical protein